MEMKYYTNMNRQEFFNYVESHSDTPRAMFRKDQVAEMFYQSGYFDKAEEVFNDNREWYSIDIRDLLEEINKKGHLKIFGNIVSVASEIKNDSLSHEELTHKISDMPYIFEREAAVIENLKRKLRS